MPQSYRFGPIDVRPAERRVLVGGRAAALGARAFDVLLGLIERRDRVVSKDELLELAWPGVIVEENNLQVQVSTLRKIFGPDAIATVSGRGYRFTLEPDASGSEPPAWPPSRHHNLPAALNSFIGRESEIREVRELLAAGPLVTLTGFGGTGKTRMSLEVAAGLADRFSDGAWFVELAPLSDPQLVPQAVAAVLGVKEVAGRPVLEALVTHARDRQFLLILDNCEHVVQACAQLARALLESNPRLKMLATSREALHLTGETTFPLPPLAVTGLHKESAAGEVAKNDAARLFVDRAAAAQPSFRLTDRNAGEVAQICRHLDGIPLAIELAAARVRALSVDTIASRLDHRLRLLAGGDKTALPRQQTLRALIDWSHDLLDDAERTLLRRLAVFAGSWMVEAAEAVTVGGAIDEPAVLDLMTSLVEKSLVSLEADGSRYRLLETVREYAWEHLEESGESAAVQARHLAWFLALAEKARVEIAGPDQAAWLARLDLDRENILAAHAWCDRAEGGSDSGLRLVRALRPYWINRGLPGLAYRLVVEALTRRGAEERTLVRCRALFDAGQLDSWMGRYAQAQGYLQESLAIARETGDPGRVEAALQSLGLAALGQGDVKAARGHFEEALALARQLGNKRNLAAALIALAQLDRVEGRLDSAEQLYGQAVSLARELGDRETIAIGLLNLAMVAVGRGQPDRAGAMLVEAIDIATAIGSKPVGQGVLDVCAGLAASHEEWEQAARFHGMAQSQLALTGLHRDPADEAFLAPLVAMARARLGAAAFDGAQAAGRDSGYEESLAEARDWTSRSRRKDRA
ncbi:MAG: tetratricopeptide repeat protein [Betaproteobacteria bacterium]|nr:tetratricopeptide repeat protein [Betaproteobacteria bacterium]